MNKIMELEKQFRAMCKKALPEFIRVNGIEYRLSSNALLSGNSYRINYAEFNGDQFLWNNQLLRLMYYVTDSVKPEPIDDFGLKDATIYVKTLGELITDCISKLNVIGYEPLDEIVTNEVKFARELTSLLNRYSKENDSDTPDYVLAGYLIGCLRNFNCAIGNKNNHEGRKRKIHIESEEIETNKI